MELLQREAIYLWYYFDVQLRQIFWYWVLGMALGSLVSVFLKDRVHGALRNLGQKSWEPPGYFSLACWALPLLCVCTEPFPLPPLFPEAVCGMIGWLPL